MDKNWEFWFRLIDWSIPEFAAIKKYAGKNGAIRQILQEPGKRQWNQGRIDAECTDAKEKSILTLFNNRMYYTSLTSEDFYIFANEREREIGYVHRHHKLNLHEKSAHWKIHLYVLPKNYKYVFRWLYLRGAYEFKLLRGGEERESDFTIYIGSFDATLGFAELLLKNIGEKLENVAEGTKVGQDIPLNEKACARFDLYKGLRGFMNANHYGVPLNMDKYMDYC